MEECIVEGHGAARILYVSYDGLADPLGRSQILPYLTRLSERGHRITILSCEKPDRMDRDGIEIRKLCDGVGIEWQALRYHKKPPIFSAVLDMAALRRAANRLGRQEKFDVVHCRSYIPALVGLALKQRSGARLLFDMRGFWPDEKLEGGSWKPGNLLYFAVYRYFKRLESRLLSVADHIISLTESGKQQLLTRSELAGDDAKISVIPCCVDFDHFPLVTPEKRADARRALGLPDDEPVVAYLGSLGGNYLIDQMLEFFRAYASRRPGAHFLFVTQDQVEPIRAAATAQGIDPGRLIIRPASRDEVPQMMAAADLGIAFKQQTFSAKGCSPTKIGEMLALGLPIITNTGVGDVETMVREISCGVTIDEFGSDSYEQALDALENLRGGAQKRRERAAPWFDVEIGVDRYEAIYSALRRQQATC